MEAFEAFVAVALEAEGFVVSEAVKFPVTLQTRKAAYANCRLTAMKSTSSERAPTASCSQPSNRSSAAAVSPPST
jgi:hypothetical protein